MVCSCWLREVRSADEVFILIGCHGGQRGAIPCADAFCAGRRRIAGVPRPETAGRGTNRRFDEPQDAEGESRAAQFAVCLGESVGEGYPFEDGGVPKIRRRNLHSGDWSGLRLFHTDRKSTRLNSSHRCISYAVFCLK